MLAHVEGVRRNGWTVATPDTGTAEHYLHVRHDQAQVPAQGWKLHVSASRSAAVEMLNLSLPVLLEEPCVFKVVRSAEVLHALNQGLLGLEQVGKCVTVYPHSSVHALELGRRLAQATAGLSAPTVSSDRQVCLAAPVFYRYGAFAPRVMQLPTGELAPFLLSPSGEAVVDDRTPAAQPPAWAVDPFRQAGLGQSTRSPATLLGGRYRRVTTVHRSARGAVELALDVHNARRVLLKTPHPWTGDDGQDTESPRARLTREATILRSLAPLALLPELLDLVEDAGRLTLVMDESRGVPLLDLVADAQANLQRLRTSEATGLIHTLATNVGRLHEAGYAHGDLSPRNVLVDEHGVVRVIDAESITRLGSNPPRLATAGYSSPQRLRGEPADVRDDIYALGSLLRLLLTGAEPSLFPGRTFPLQLPLHRYNPAVTGNLEAVVARCTADAPSDRFSSTDALIDALAGVRPYLSVTPQALRPSPAPAPASSSVEAADIAQRIAETICALAVDAGSGAMWRTGSATGLRVPSTDLGDGVAGILVALSAAARSLNHEGSLEALDAGARWLRSAPSHRDAGAGLYAGRAGVALALLHAGLQLKDNSLLDDACRVAAEAGTQAYGNPDLYTGAAGRLRVHTALWRFTADARQRQHATEAAAFLRACVQDTPAGPAWMIPEGYGNLSGRTWLGAAHGTAGIADALLDWSTASGDPDAFDLASRAAASYAAYAESLADDGASVHWHTPLADAESVGATWCHGVVGISGFLLRYAQAVNDPAIANLAAAAGTTVADRHRSANPVLCHGLSGTLALLANLTPTMLPDHHRHVSLVLDLLSAYLKDDDGWLTCQSDEPELLTPELMRGMAGVLLTLLRLTDPTSIDPLVLIPEAPHQAAAPDALAPC